MAKLSPEEFEALWEECKKGPVVRESQVVHPHSEVSLSAILDQFLVMAASYLTEGKINKADHDALVAGIGGLKPVLERINEKELIAQEISNRAKMTARMIQDQVTNLTRLR